jgi:hypothetical protein
MSIPPERFAELVGKGYQSVLPTFTQYFHDQVIVVDVLIRKPKYFTRP